MHGDISGPLDFIFIWWSFMIFKELLPFILANTLFVMFDFQHLDSVICSQMFPDNIYVVQ